MQRIRKRLPRRFRLGVPAASAGRFRLLPGCFRAGFVWGSGGCIIWLLIWFQGAFKTAVRTRLSGSLDASSEVGAPAGVFF